MNERELALAGLLACLRNPNRRLIGFIRDLGPSNAWRAIVEAPYPDWMDAHLNATHRTSMLPHDLYSMAMGHLQTVEQVGARLITWGDPEWPTECFENMDHPPIALYVRGRWLPTVPENSISIVGARSATPYGMTIATQFAQELVESAQTITSGKTIVSGAAFGIDGAAHRGALSTNRSWTGTVAVLPCGIDRAYPVAHADLINSIAKNGTLVSEYPPGTVPARERFLARNRLIAAFSKATVVIEAARRSGSLNAANHARSMGRDVLAVPGPITSATSVGCHDLIKAGDAKMVTSAQDVLKYYED